jgi:Na+-driven multidrug efflux pump
MTNLAVPTIITSFLEMLPGIVTIILVGRAEYDSDVGDDIEGEMTTSMKQLHLDAAALAVMIMNVVALSPAFGKCK